MAIVVDASVSVDWCIATEIDPRAELAIERIQREPSFVPTLWWFEVRNALLLAERHGAADW